MPIISDFESSLSKHSRPSYAQWRPVDLHNHSPVSFDYEGNKADAISAGISHLSTANVEVVMFTDHHTLPKQEFVDEIQRGTGKTILRGVEVNIFVDAWGKPETKVQKQAYFHLLVGFPPTVDADYWFKLIKQKCGHEERDISGNKIPGLTSRVDHICEAVAESGAIIIPAHLHKKHNAFKSRSVDDIYMDEEFLKLAKNHFTALEVTDPKTAQFFDGKHEETDRLHKSCIRSSDAHDVTLIGQRVTYVQMESPTFEELKASLEIPSRVSLEEPALPSSYIIGLNIRGQFFQDFWLSFSPNCNAMIGVKGSGKTSVLECLRFALGALVPDSRKDEVQSHLTHILGESGSVRVLVRREDGAKVLVERNASNPDSFNLIFEDDRREEVRNPEALMFTSFILGWHEIEQAATDVAVRQAYLDTIADREKIRQLQEVADEGIGQIKSLHEQVANRYSSFMNLRGRVSLLRDLRSGLQKLSDAKLVELKDTYETASQHRESMEGLASWLDTRSKQEFNLQASDVVPDFPSLDGESPIREFANQATEMVNDLRNHVGQFTDAHRRKVEEHAVSLAQSMPGLASAMDAFATKYDEAVSALSDEQRKLLQSHRQVLDQTRALPSLEHKMDEERGKLEEMLTKLANLCDSVADALDDQTTLRRSRVEDLGKELIGFGVRLDVAPRSRLSMFENIAASNPDGASVFGELNTQFSGSNRHHRRLAQGYRRAKADLVQGFPLLLSSMAFSDYLAAFEGDDLNIYFNVGQIQEDYRPIDQLSAGQRCTAVFPLLLKLQEGPLIVDQPEDNLDNRHIADAIAPALVEDKKGRQIAFTSHNANLVVLTDAEQIAMFESDGAKGSVSARGFLCMSESEITQHVIAILDGGREALRLRYQKYGVDDL